MQGMQEATDEKDGASAPYVVLCQYDQPFDTYGLFLHEADLMLIELGNAVNRGVMTVEEAGRIWEPYRHLAPQLFDPSYKERTFPALDPEADALPVTQRFDEAVQSLEIPGAGYVSPSAGTGTFVTIKGEALEAVRQALHDQYRIVVLDGNEPEEYWKGGTENMQRAIAWARDRAGLGG